MSGFGRRYGQWGTLWQHLRRCQRRCDGIGYAFPATAEEGVAGKKRVAQQTREYIRRFQDRFTDLNCAELLLNKEIQGTQQAELLGVANHCGILIISAVEILCDYIAELKEE